MTQNTISKIQMLVEPGAIFGSAITSGYIELSNYKYIDFVISSGEGTEANVTVTVKAKAGAAGTASTIPFQQNNGKGTAFTAVPSTGATLTIGGEEGECGYAIYRVNADMLSHYGFDRVNINVTSAANSTVPGCVTAVLYEPRYSD